MLADQRQAAQGGGRDRGDRPGAHELLGVARAIQGALMWDGAPAQDVLELGRRAVIQSYRAGESVWVAGAPADRFSVILRGLVLIRRHHPDGGGSAWAIFGPRDAVGLGAVVGDFPYPADAVALAAGTRVAWTSRDDLYRCLDRSPAHFHGVAQRVARNAQQLHASLQAKAGARVPARIASVLLFLADRYGDETDDGSICIPIPLTRRVIGELAETRVESVIRAMSGWQREGIIRSRPGELELVSVPRLRALADTV